MTRPKFGRWLRSPQGAMVLFGFAVVLLVALGVWWFVFLEQSIRQERNATLQILDRDLKLAALTLPPEPTPGPLQSNATLQVVPAAQPVARLARWLGDGADATDAKNLQPNRKWRIEPSPAFLKYLDDHYAKRRGMILGEGLLLSSLLVTVVGMLFSLHRAELRFRKEWQEFLGRVTHEMKTPIAGIKAVLQTIQAGRMPQDQLVQLTTLALSEAEREEHLIQNILLAQRMRLRGQQLAKEDLDLRALLARFVEHRHATHTDGAEMILEADVALRCVGDGTAIWTILENLADNAVKYGGTHLKLRAGLDGGQKVKVSLQDDGMGFDPALGKALFEPFARSAGFAVARHGTGLGLHISRALAEHMGGRLQAASEGPGQGATFTLTLPAAPPPS